MNGYDIQLYQRVSKMASNYDMVIEARGERISLHVAKGKQIGIFDNINDIFNFLCGYELGIAQTYIEPLTK